MKIALISEHASPLATPGGIDSGMRTPFLLDRFPDLDPARLQEPATVAEAVVNVLTLPAASVVPEISVLPMGETSWP